MISIIKRRCKRLWRNIARKVGTGNLDKILVRKPVKFCFGSPAMFGRIISKFMMKRTEGMEARFIWLRIGISGGFLSTGRREKRVLVNVV